MRRSAVLPPLLLAVAAGCLAAPGVVAAQATEGDLGDGPAAALDVALATAEAALRAGEAQVAESRYRDVLAAGWTLLGELAAAEGDPEAARDAFARAAGATVEHRRATTALALVELETGREESAVQRFQGLLADQPDDLATRRLLAAALDADGRPEEALQELEEARVRASGDPELAYALGTAHLRAGRIDEAAALFDEVARARPIPATHVLLGRTYRDAREFERAEAELRRALEIDPATPRAHFYLATLHLLAEGRAELEQAEAELERELEVSPGDPTTLLYLGMTRVENRDHQAAVAPLEAARAEPALVLEAHHFLGRALLALDRPAEAATALRRALEIAEDGGGDSSALRSIHYQLGLALRRSGDAEAGVEHLEAAERLSSDLTAETRDALRVFIESGATRGTDFAGAAPAPRLRAARYSALPAAQRQRLRAVAEEALTRSYLNLGILQARQGRPERAAGLVAEAADLSPDFPGVQRTLGAVLFDAGEHRRAVAPLTRALAESPGDRGLARSLGLAHLESGDYEAAAGLLAGEAARSPDDAQLAYAYGLALVRSGRTERAEAIFADLLERHGADARVQVLLGQAEAQEDDFAAAVGHFERALALDAAVPDARESLGVIHLRRGELEAAEAVLRAELERQPEAVRPRYLLATVLDLSGRGEEAAGELRRVLARSPGHVDARYLLGKTLLAGGDAEAAVTQLETAAELAPTDPNVRYQLGLAYQRLGRRDEAAAEFDRFRELKDAEQGEGQRQGDLEGVEP